MRNTQRFYNRIFVAVDIVYQYRMNLKVAAVLILRVGIIQKQIVPKRTILHHKTCTRKRKSNFRIGRAIIEKPKW